MALVFACIFAFLIAGLIGNKRKIGFGWSLAACLLLSPVIGLIITLCSEKLPTEGQSNNVDEEKPLTDVLTESNNSTDAPVESAPTDNSSTDTQESTTIDY